MRKFFLALMALISFSIVDAQTKNHWKQNNAPERVKTHKSVGRASFPKAFKAFDLDIPAFAQELMTIVGKNKVANKVRVTFPNAEGGIEEFELVESSNFEPALQEKFPEIRAYSGRGITDPYATIKVSLSPDGVQTMTMRADRENEFIEQFSDDKKTYAVFRSQRKPGALPWDCTTKAEAQMVASINDQAVTLNTVSRSGNNLRTLRLAQSCNAEYSRYFGASGPNDVGLVLAAFNATLTRCNGIYEKDLALHLNLIPETEKVIFYNPATDPYTTLSNWNTQLQTTLTKFIGESNYDIGHMFGASGGGGNAGCIGCICVDGSKGRGITSPADGVPKGDNFDIDYVAHEVGHQLGANHTFSMSNEGTGQNKEVGSGITIMGYAGITSQDVAPHSIDVFHQTSIAQVQANLLNRPACGVNDIISNTGPAIVVPSINRTIPKSTPFALTASATDLQGDLLTFSWEQDDNASSKQTGTNSIASPTKTTGPNWISYTPSASPTKLFPRLPTILAGGLVSGSLGGDASANTEALSSVARTLQFRLTVRDNALYIPNLSVGQTNFANVTVTVNGTAGPFSVASANTAVVWPANSSQTITWNVNGTNLSPVSCANVKITLSTDGGSTFPFVLAETTPNDGSQLVTIPEVATSTARIKIEAIDNIFFDINNANITITAPPACGDPVSLNTTNITTTQATLNWTAVSGALSYKIEYKTLSASAWIILSDAINSNTTLLSGLTAGTEYNWRVTARCSAGEGNPVASSFTTRLNCGDPTNLVTTSITTTSAAISWSPVSGATSYRVEYKTAAASTWTLLTASQPGTSANLNQLTPGTSYLWRVQATCSTEAGNYTTSSIFTTGALGCASVYDNSTNNSWGTGAAMIPFNTNITGQINVGTDVDFYAFVLNAGGTVNLSLTNLPANFDLQLINGAGKTLVTSRNSGTKDEIINNRILTAGIYYARVYPSTTSISNSNCYTLRVNLVSGSRMIEEISGSANPVNAAEIDIPTKTIVYPNPVRAILNISNAAGGNDIIVYNGQGEQVMKTKSARANSRLDVSSLPAGLYLVKILKEGRLVSQLKVIKE